MANTPQLHPIAGCTADRKADVIFVHGLGGDPFETWRRDDFFWPEVLGGEMPHVGIWSLGYPAAKSDWSGSAMPLADRALNALTLLEAHDIGKLPLIFVVHSLGGLLVKQMLRHSGEFGQSAWLAIRNATRGIAFLATPNNGSRLANWTNYWSVLRPSAAMQDLELNDSRLRELNLWFRNNVHSLGCRLVVFYEKLPLGPVIVVDEASSDPGIAGVIPIPLDDNHASICKPASTGSLQYMQVKRLIGDLVPREPASAPDAAPVRDIAARPGCCLLNVGHWRPNEINAVAFSPCSRYVAAASDDGTVRVWRASSEDLLLTIAAHDNMVKSVCWSPDGRYLASCSADGSAKVWTFPVGALHWKWTGHDDWARAIAWSGDARSIACGYANGAVRVFEPGQCAERARIKAHDGRVRGVAMSPCSQYLATGGTDGIVAIWSVEDGARQAAMNLGELFRPDERDRAQVICVAWSPSGDYLIAGTISGHVAVIDTFARRIVRSDKVCRDSVLSLCWSPDSDEFAIGSSDRIALRVALSALPKSGALDRILGMFGAAPSRGRKIATHAGSVRAVAWSPDGRSIATGSTDETLRIQGAHGSSELTAHQLQLRCAALSGDGQMLAVGSIARTVMLFDLKSNTHQWTFEGTSDAVRVVDEAAGKSARLIEKRREGLDEYARCLAFSRNGKSIAVGIDDRTVRVLNVRTGLADGPVLANCHEDVIHCLAWSPDGHRIVSCSGSLVALWSRSSKPARTMRAHRGRILAVAWAPSGQAFVTTAEDKTVMLWHELTSRELCTCGAEILLLAWSSDEKFIVGAGRGGHAYVWNAQYGKLVAEIPTEGGVRSLAWARDRCFMALDKGHVLEVEQGSWKIRSRFGSLPPTHRSLCMQVADSMVQPGQLILPELHLACDRVLDLASAHDFPA